MLKLSHPITAINGFKIGDRVRLKDGDGRTHIIKSFSVDGIKEFFFEVQFEDGTETMLDNIAPLTSNPSLPSNLDEAAESAVNDWLAYGDGKYANLFIAGWKDCHEQMMKEAVEGRIGEVGFHNAVYIQEPKWTNFLDGFKKGDWVKIILLKED